MERILKLEYDGHLPNNNEANYFLGLTYLLNLRQDLEKSPRDTAKAIAHLQKFLSRAHLAAAELPEVRAQLRRLGELE